MTLQTVIKTQRLEKRTVMPLGKCQQKCNLRGEGASKYSETLVAFSLMKSVLRPHQMQGIPAAADQRAGNGGMQAENAAMNDALLQLVWTAQLSA